MRPVSAKFGKPGLQVVVDVTNVTSPFARRRWIAVEMKTFRKG